MGDVVVIGAGAAGLTAAIFAAEQLNPEEHQVVVLDGALKPGDKILISGGGRCNLTNKSVTADDYNGGAPDQIASILEQFGSERAQDWIHNMGVRLKTESDGRVFPANDNSHAVLNALLRQLKAARVDLRCSHKVTGIKPHPTGFTIQSRGPNGPRDDVNAHALIIATGGLSMPESGSDGSLMKTLGRFGHTIIPTTPALVGLVLESSSSVGGSFCALRGSSIDGILSLYERTGSERKLLATSEGTILFTHYGLNGPAPKTFSRHWLRALVDNPQAELEVSMSLTQHTDPIKLDRWMCAHTEAQPRRFVSSMLGRLLPVKLAKLVAAAAGGDVLLSHLDEELRAAIIKQLLDTPITITDTRGYDHAEATAGGIDLKEVDIPLMQSQRIPGLYLCGEILDVDGPAGGYNFQWAWSSGHLAGLGAAKQILSRQTAASTAQTVAS